MWLATALVHGCATGLDNDSALTTIPYRLDPGGRVVIDAWVNERGPFRFALDTASSGSFVFGGLAERLELEPIAEREATVRGALASGLFPLVAIDSLRIGTARHADLELIILPGTTLATSGLDGVLGADFLRRYAVGFSVRENRVRLYAPAAVDERSYRGWASIPLRPVLIGRSAEPVYFFDIAVAGQRLSALFDLGAGINIINRATVDRLGLTTIRAGEAGEFSGAIASSSVLARFGSQAITTAGIRWRDELFLIADLEVFTTLDYADRPLAILGSGLFTQRDFVIDFSRQRVLVRVAMAETPVTSLEADGEEAR